MKSYFLESCVTNVDDALHADAKGADRLEICSKLETEGMTPDIELVKSILERINIPIRVMIRETEHGFEADEEVIEKMITAIDRFKLLPIEGFVLGVLKNNRVDRDAMKFLLQHAHPFPVTFHKAIDLSEKKWEDIEWINDHPLIDTILTSGGAIHAADGTNEILEMKARFRGDIMAGGKITSPHLPLLHEKLQLKWYHGRNILTGQE